MLKEHKIGSLVEVIDPESDFYKARLFIVSIEYKKDDVIYGLSGNKKRKLTDLYLIKDKKKIDYNEALKFAKSMIKRAQIDRIFSHDQLKVIRKAE